MSEAQQPIETKIKRDEYNGHKFISITKQYVKDGEQKEATVISFGKAKALEIAKHWKDIAEYLEIR